MNSNALPFSFRELLSRNFSFLDSQEFSELQAVINESKTSNAIALIGLPNDSSTVFRPGARFGPNAIRQFSDNLESFSPFWKKNLYDIAFTDLGNLRLPRTNTQKVFQQIEKSILEIIDLGIKPLSLGGDHSISYPAIAAVAQKYPDLAIVHLDAHADLRSDYDGEKYSHACSMGNSLTIFPGKTDRLFQWGIRSFTEDEYRQAIDMNSLFDLSKASLDQMKKRIGQRNVYLTIDLDIFDPAFMSGTGTPESGGWSYNEFLILLRELPALNIVAADVVELAPLYDPSGASSALAAKVTRDVIYLLHECALESSKIKKSVTMNSKTTKKNNKRA